ncbi:hypothetical protein [Fulvimonas soli]|jgi:hypothetical protein|uniref:hypothetical protein n=1 Tax=Fulvimonas soli TaxID=155197 RepID=UPI0011242F94|nr:hypothetical protein [Fulvimonas soli]
MRIDADGRQDERTEEADVRDAIRESSTLRPDPLPPPIENIDTYNEIHDAASSNFDIHEEAATASENLKEVMDDISNGVASNKSNENSGVIYLVNGENTE